MTPLVWIKAKLENIGFGERQMGLLNKPQSWADQPTLSQKTLGKNRPPTSSPYHGSKAHVRLALFNRNIMQATNVILSFLVAVFKK